MYTADHTTSRLLPEGNHSGVEKVFPMEMMEIFAVS